MAITKRELQRLIYAIPAKRWFLIGQALDMRTEDIMQDFIAQMVVAANEWHRKDQAAEGGRVRDDFARFLELGLVDLMRAARLIDEDEDPYEADDEDAAADGGDDDDPKRGDAGGGVLAGAGPVLPADGPVAG